VVEIIIAPNRLQRIINVALLGNSIDEVKEGTMSIRADGIYIEDKKSPFLGVKAFFPSHFFIQYKPTEENEKICLTKTMLDPFHFHRAFEEEKLKVITKDNKMFYYSIDKEGKNLEAWRDNLQKINELKFTFELPDSDKGFLPVAKEPITQALLEVSQCRIHPCDYYRIISTPKDLQLEVSEPGVYRRILKLSKEPPKLGEITYEVAGDVWEAIVGMYSGEVWLNLYDVAIVMSQKTKDSNISYVFSPRPVEG